MLMFGIHEGEEAKDAQHTHLVPTFQLEENGAKGYIIKKYEYNLLAARINRRLMAARTPSKPIVPCDSIRHHKLISHILLIYVFFS